MAFEQQAKSRGLKDKTIASLVGEDYDTMEALLTLTAEDMEYLKVSRAQQGILNKWIQELQAEDDADTETVTMVTRTQTRDDGTSETTTTETRISGGAKVKLDTTEVNSEATLGLSGDVEQEVEEYIQKHGVHDLDKFLKNQLSKYQEAPINVAVTGQSGAGKSSFINCVRQLYGDDDGAAAVGVKETTMVVKPYPDPLNPNIIYWDLPGIGTDKFPRENYLDVVDFLKYDFFLILSSERFKEDDLFLAKCIHDSKKQFYFLRTKIDSDLSNDKRARPRQHDPKQLMVQVRDDCVLNLRTGELPTENIFIVSSHLEDKARFDFPILMETIVQNAPAKKRSSLILSLTACSEKGIEEKKAELEKRIPTVARLASLDERVAQTRQDRIVEEVNFYKKQFGLNEDGILKMGVDRKTLTQRTTDVLGPPGKVLLTVARGLSNVLALPWKAFRNVTGIQKKHEIEIAGVLRETLVRCAEAALEILHLRQGIHESIQVRSDASADPKKASVAIGIGIKGPKIGHKVK